MSFYPENDSIQIFNNTLIGKSNPGKQVRLLNSSSAGAGKLNIKNNIFSKEGSQPQIYAQAIYFDSLNENNFSNNILNHNLYWNNNPGITPTIKFQDVNRVWNYILNNYYEESGVGTNPQFISSTDYNLEYSSPAKNKGTNLFTLGITKDKFGNNRPYWNRDFDIGAFEIEDTQLKFTSNIGLQTTHSLTYAGAYWERNSSGVNGVFNVSTDQGLGSATCLTPATAPNDDEIWRFPGVEYKWMDWSNNNSGSRIAAGLYKITNSSNAAYFYLDMRDAVESYNLNVYLKLGQDGKYYFRQNGTFTGHDITNGSVKRIWEINSGQPQTIALSSYWANVLAVVRANNHPLIIWGPYPVDEKFPEVGYYSISRKNGSLLWQDEFTTTPYYKYDYEDTDFSLSGYGGHTVQYKVRAGWDDIYYSDYSNTGSIIVSGDDPGKKNVPVQNYDFSLFQNFPNPFNPSTTISFSIPEEELVNMKLYDILGKEVKVLVHSIMKAGRYNVTVNLSSLSSGVYFYIINAGEYSSIKKMQLLK